MEDREATKNVLMYVPLSPIKDDPAENMRRKTPVQKNATCLKPNNIITMREMQQHKIKHLK